MGIYIEALILYILIFLHGSLSLFTGSRAESANFSATAEIVNIFAYLIPALMLIWHLIIKTQKIEMWVLRPGKKDFLSFFITFPCLLITAFSVTFIGSYIGGSTGNTSLNLPSSGIEWILLFITCFLSAYLEESYFRFYLLTKREELNLNAVSSLVFSVILCAVCHLYEGPWGFLNAVISGAIFGFVFLRYNSLHGIAVAHALYNISIFVIYRLNI
jgi:membrane protease YdiL (CAAX protease family)